MPDALCVSSWFGTSRGTGLETRCPAAGGAVRLKKYRAAACVPLPPDSGRGCLDAADLGCPPYLTCSLYPRSCCDHDVVGLFELLRLFQRRPLVSSSLAPVLTFSSPSLQSFSPLAISPASFVWAAHHHRAYTFGASLPSLHQTSPYSDSQLGTCRGEWRQWHCAGCLEHARDMTGR